MLKCEDPGKFDKRIELQQLELVPDTVGGNETVWSVFKTVWAKVRPLSAREISYASSPTHRVTHKILIRYLPDVNARMRILLGTRLFNIHGIVNVEEANSFLELTCEEGKPS